MVDDCDAAAAAADTDVAPRVYHTLSRQTCARAFNGKQ